MPSDMEECTCAECEKHYVCEEIDDIVVDCGYSPPLGERKYLHFCSRDCMDDFQQEYTAGYEVHERPFFEEV